MHQNQRPLPPLRQATGPAPATSERRQKAMHQNSSPAPPPRAPARRASTTSGQRQKPIHHGRRRLPSPRKRAAAMRPRRLARTARTRAPGQKPIHQNSRPPRALIRRQPAMPERGKKPMQQNSGWWPPSRQPCPWHPGMGWPRQNPLHQNRPLTSGSGMASACAPQARPSACGGNFWRQPTTTTSPHGRPGSPDGG